MSADEVVTVCLAEGLVSFRSLHGTYLGVDASGGQLVQTDAPLHWRVSHDAGSTFRLAASGVCLGGSGELVPGDGDSSTSVRWTASLDPGTGKLQLSSSSLVLRACDDRLSVVVAAGGAPSDWWLATPRLERTHGAPIRTLCSELPADLATLWLRPTVCLSETSVTAARYGDAAAASDSGSSQLVLSAGYALLAATLTDDDAVRWAERVLRPPQSSRCRWCTPPVSRADFALPALNSSWVPLTGRDGRPLCSRADGAPMRVLAMSRPTFAGAQSGLWQCFERERIGAVVCLTQPGEHPHCGDGLLPDAHGLPYDPALLSQRRIDWFDYSFQDLMVPSFEHALAACRQLSAVYHQRGQRAAVHCHAGIGRTGLIIACWFVLESALLAPDAYDPDADARHAIDTVRKYRQGAIQNKVEDQAAFVQQFAVWLSDHLHNTD